MPRIVQLPIPKPHVGKFSNSEVTIKLYTSYKDKDYSANSNFIYIDISIFIFILHVYLDITLYSISAYDLEIGKAEYFLLNNLSIHIISLHHKEQQKRIF